MCGTCALRARCTVGKRRLLKKHLDDDALRRLAERATAEAMRLRRSLAGTSVRCFEIFDFWAPAILLRGLRGARTEIGLAVMAYNLKRMIAVRGVPKLAAQLA